MIKSLQRYIRNRFYILDGKLGFDYFVSDNFDMSRKAELLITRHYRAIVVGFEAALFGYKREQIDTHDIHSFCLLGFHLTFYTDSASLIETVDGRLLNATTRQLLKRKEMP